MIWVRAQSHGAIDEKSYLQGSAEQAFNQWAQQYGKNYLSEPHEYAKRPQIWKDNVDKIRVHKSTANSNTRLGLTAFTDLTAEEFKAKYLGQPMVPRSI
eukprot:jgi/Chrzof1/14341/UNPLg00615.t1